MMRKSMPADKNPGDRLLAASVNLTGRCVIRVEQALKEIDGVDAKVNLEKKQRRFL